MSAVGMVPIEPPAVFEKDAVTLPTAPKCSSTSLYSSPSVGSSHPSTLDPESDSEASPNEPATPASGRPSQDFSTTPWQHLAAVDEDSPQLLATTPTKRISPSPSINHLNLVKTVSQVSDETERCFTTISTADDCSADCPTLGRRTSRSGNLKRTMTNLFKRTASSASVANHDASSIMTADSRKDVRNSISVVVPPRPGRRWSMYRASGTRSSTPPSPRSPNEAGASAVTASTKGARPTPEDFKKRGRVSTGLESIRVRVGLPHHHKAEKLRRANSLESIKQPPAPPRPDDSSLPMVRQHLFNPPEEGVGLKARRMSLCLPDDFNVDVGNLLEEYEYNSRLGRHGKHLGKGATSKVNVMVRKGAPGELYAVKEFRPRNAREDKDEYEKKVKSEYSIAKSLHHPNIVESFRLCLDNNSRWNHVMEYCTDGDLFSLVKKGYLKEEARTADRLCLFKQLVQGINYLHSHGIAHRDIKLENLLVTDRCKLKITDFGISEVFLGIHPGLREAGGLCGMGMEDGVIRWSKGRCGSQPYMAPEVLLKTAPNADDSSANSYDPRAIDVWSSAVIMIYLTFGGGLWEIANTEQRWYRDLVVAWDKVAAKREKMAAEKLAEKMADQTSTTSAAASTTASAATSDSEASARPDLLYPNYEPFKRAIKTPILRRMLLQMLHPDPQQRISIGEVAANRWLRNVDCCQPENYEEPRPFDASKQGHVPKKVCCHNHLPPASHSMTMPSLGKMPGHAGY